MIRRKSILLLLSAFLILLLLALWWGMRPVTDFTEDKKILYLRTEQTSLETLHTQLTDSHIIKKNTPFLLLAGWMGMDGKINPGKYAVRRGMNLPAILRMLRNNEQAPVKIVINKFRTPEQLAGFIGKRLECDSTKMAELLHDTSFLNQWGLDTNTWMTAIIPNTYEFYWSVTAEQVFRRLHNEQKKFWTEERLGKAASKQMAPLQVYILASILDEETNANEEKDTMASVYINRIRQNIPLQADPTVKFALKDFSLKRIYKKHLQTPSPYNTYINTGLPPGPICTPSIPSLDAVLNAPETEYIYFVAKSDFSGRHVFSKDYDMHRQHAKNYQRALNEQQRIREAREKTKITQ